MRNKTNKRTDKMNKQTTATITNKSTATKRNLRHVWETHTHTLNIQNFVTAKLLSNNMRTSSSHLSIPVLHHILLLLLKPSFSANRPITYGLLTHILSAEVACMCSKQMITCSTCDCHVICMCMCFQGHSELHVCSPLWLNRETVLSRLQLWGPF